MNISLTKGHGRCPVLKFCTWTIFNVCLHIFSNWILKCLPNGKCEFACLFSCTKIWEIVIKYLWKYALKSGHKSISKVTSFWNFILYVEMVFRIVFLCLLRLYNLFFSCKLSSYPSSSYYMHAYIWEELGLREKSIVRFILLV